MVRGRVQGVFFRASVARMANERGVAGSAENMNDGSVEVVLEGPREAVNELISFCSEGPRGAHVSQVDVTEEEPQGLEGFATG